MKEANKCGHERIMHYVIPITLSIIAAAGIAFLGGSVRLYLRHAWTHAIFANLAGVLLLAATVAVPNWGHVCTFIQLQMENFGKCIIIQGVLPKSF
jgi:hypothetical protein